MFYSGWLNGAVPSVSFGIDDNDINAFMGWIKLKVLILFYILLVGK